MTDDLRARIAAALKAEDGKLHICPFDGEPTMSSYDNLADAVIHELGLDRQAHYDPDCDYYRYVTDWISPVTGNKIDLP